MRSLIATALAVLLVSLASPPVAAQASSPYPVRHEELGTLWRDGLGDDYVSMGRTTIQPAAAMAPTRFSGDWVARIDSGELTVTSISGGVEIEGNDAEDWPRPGESVEVGQWTRLRFGPDAVMTWANEGTVPVVILTVAIVDGDVEPMEDAALTTDGPYHPMRGKVRTRVVVVGAPLGYRDYRPRIVVRDRSGQLVGARMPKPSELRFVRGSLLESDERVTLGPVRSIDGDVNEVLVTWTTGTCGPVATIDIGKELLPGRDVAALKVTDRSPGCDSSGKSATVVLRFRGPWTSVEDMDARLVYR